MTLSEYWLQINEERLHSRSKTWKCFPSGTFTEASGVTLPRWSDEPQVEAVGAAAGLRCSPGGGSCSNVTMKCKHDFFFFSSMTFYIGG